MLLPLCHGGKIVRFEISDAGFIPAELQKKFPRVHALNGIAADGTTADIVTSSDGIHAQIWMVGDQDNCFVDPHTKGDPTLHTIYTATDMEPGSTLTAPYNSVRSSTRSLPGRSLAYYRSHISAAPGSSSGEVSKNRVLGKRRSRGHSARRAQDAAAAARLKSGRQLADRSSYIQPPPAGASEVFTYRLAVACSYDYVEYAGSPEKALVLLSATLHRAGGIWRRTAGINLKLIDNQDKLFEYGPDELPETCEDTLDENGLQLITKKGVQPEEFDVGHFFGVTDEGGSGAGLPCNDATKVNGYTCDENPKGDSFDVNYVAHELGHQWDLPHTWSGSRGICTQDQFDPTASIELGAGKTLETYAGSCDGDNTHRPSSPNHHGNDPYFNVYSLSGFQKWLQKDTGGKASGCGAYEKKVENSRPTVTVPATCAIPRKTPYILTGSATDPDTKDTLKYNWEQLDSASRQTSLDVESADGPLVISALPSTAGATRYIPPLASATQGVGRSIDKLNRLSSRKRTLHFALTARDHYSSVGDTGGALDTQVFGTWDADTVAVDVSSMGPLTITIPAKSATNIVSGSSTVAWQIPGAQAAGSETAAKSLLAADYSVYFLPCDDASCFGKTALTLWQTIASGVTVSDAGKGSTKIFIPASAEGKKIRIAVSGQVPNGAGCTFWEVSPILNVLVGKTSSSLQSTYPANDATGISTGIKIFRLVFDSPIFVDMSSTAKATVLVDGGASTSYSTMHLTAGGTFLSLNTTGGTMQASTKHTVTISPDMLCAAFVPLGGSCPPNAKLSGNFSFVFTTGATTGATPPALVLADPAFGLPFGNTTDGKMDVDAMNGMGATIDIILNQNIFLAASGNVTINDKTFPQDEYCTIPLGDPSQVTIDGMKLRLHLNAACRPWPGTTYEASIPAGTLANDRRTTNVGILAVTWNTAPDSSPPTVEAMFPKSGAVGVPEYADFSLLFSKPIQWRSGATGSIMFKCISPAVKNCENASLDIQDSSVVELYEDGEILFLPENELASNAKFSVLFPANVIEDHMGNAFAGISESAYIVTTGDTWPPVFKSAVFAPSGGPGTADNLVTVTIEFDNDDGLGLKKGTRGLIKLIDTATNATRAAVGITAPNVTISGSNVTVKFATALPGPATYRLAFNDAIVLDKAGNGCSGLGGQTKKGLYDPNVAVSGPTYTTTVKLPDDSGDTSGSTDDTSGSTDASGSTNASGSIDTSGSTGAYNPQVWILCAAALAFHLLYLPNV
jgi:hypothetical protein